MSRILVTGADGFIGSHLVEALVELGHEVSALAYYNSMGSLGWMNESNVRKEVRFHLGDVRDAEICRKISKHQDVIFNLAALIGIPYSYEAVNSYMQTNVQGTINMCQAGLEAGIQKFVQISTSEVYGTAQYVPISEEHPLAPQSPYSASKIAADSFARSFSSSFELPLLIARPFNTYGPRQSLRAFIPAAAVQLMSKGDEINMGDLSPTRDLTFVEDTCRALVELMHSTVESGQVVNIGSNNEYSVGEVIALMQQLLGTNKFVRQEQVRIRPAGSEVHRLVCDNAKLKALTGFVPGTTLRDGLQATLTWLENNQQDAIKSTSRYSV